MNTINKRIHVPANRFFEDRGHVFVSDGKTPICGWLQNPAPHTGLPLGDYNAEREANYVVEKGTAVSFFESMLVPANGGIANTVTYNDKDVSGNVLDDNGAVVTVGSTKTFDGNKPVGVVVWDILQNPKTINGIFKTDLTQDTPTLRTDGVIVLPIVYKTDDGIDADATFDALEKADAKLITSLYKFGIGDLVVADSMADATQKLYKNILVPTAATGKPRKFLSSDLVISAETADKGFVTIAADSIEQVFGRVIAVADEYEAKDLSLELTKTDGIEVQGDGTHGFDRNLYNAFKETLLSADKDLYYRGAVMININK